MKRLRAALRRLVGMFSGGRREQEFNNEMEGHLQMHIDDKVRAGMTAEEARRDALRKLGGLEQTRQAYRERGTAPFFETLWQDLRFAARQLVKNPGFTITAVLMLSLGTAASVAIFAFVDAALLKPLPYEDPRTLVDVTESVAVFPHANLSYPDYLDWKKMNHSFRSLDVYTGAGYLLDTPSGVEPVPGLRVTDGFFHTLGVAPLLGRDFYSGEDLLSAPRTVILSYSAWQTRFGGRKDIVGQVVSLSGTPYTIVGVMPDSFEFAPRNNAEFWTTMHAGGSNSCDLRRSCHSLVGVARLKDGVSVAAALADTKAIAQQLERQYPDSNRGQGATVQTLTEAFVGDIRPILLLLLAGAGLLLLIACVNVASLLLVRSESRRREIVVRGALGASPLRLVRQFVTEGVLLVLGSTLLGLVCAVFASQALLRLIPKDMRLQMPYLRGLGLNFHAVCFALAIATLATAIFSLTPIVRLSFGEMREGLTEGSRGSAGVLWRKIGANLTVLELAIATVLLVGAGLLGKSFYRLLHVELNFQPDHLATLSVALPEKIYTKDEQIVAARRQLLNRIAALPGATSVATTSTLPVTYNGNTEWIRFVGREYNGEHNEVNERDVTANFFSTLKTKLIRGRFFNPDEDGTKPRVVIINQAFVKQYFSGQDPLGARIGDTTLSPKSIKEVVGVVDDLRESKLNEKTLPAVYYPADQSPDTEFNLVVRTTQDEKTLLPTLVSTIHQFDRGIGTSEESTMFRYINESETAYLHRSSAWLVGGFAALALLLGMIGLYGVIAYSVGQRTREIGVRMALGAQREMVQRMVLKEGGRLAALGIVVGLVCSLAATSLLRSMLFGVHSWDVGTLAGVALLLAAVALLASYVPARRAASINPVEALRAE
ncbi:ABC transporter permease [Tunturiibacter empetritectus]|uniref:Permease n=1 Tax=Tunturiibacter lichenicola TaxID=2051959 RepID=A0A852VPF7_9BACT|nr:ABC transporter permease [Edaphobacter lichenicola]NYF91945.1 putative permease [Edaphobacter lichenicola]